MYRKTACSTFVASLALVASLPALAQNDGTLQITGRIEATTCKVENITPGTGAARKVVALDRISAASLATVNQTAGDRGFVILVGGNDECVDGLKAKVRFDPASPLLDPVSGHLKVEPAADAASNVQVDIADSTGKSINLYTQDSPSVEITEHKASIPLIARYISLGGATAGSANSSIGFQIVYD
ncbi:fimbrial protein [Luteibacter sp. ME-Dv--P-043b]|uniref:fimbrial protein n=1 Tax=Luteibacter sp. ME-Dv--P-043b TaxID=3040291 RepID=UPI002556FEE8|nr:fimbrial protein [Luteibacter sp. ME-Dv--P-043b]